jgi:hypothetical protein
MGLMAMGGVAREFFVIWGLGLTTSYLGPLFSRMSSALGINPTQET